MANQKSFPLSWPDGWARTNASARVRSNFKRSGHYSAQYHSMDECLRTLGAELDRLGAKDQILSTNVKLRLDGLPYSGAAQPTDTGAAVYFKLKGKEMSLACDKWNRVEDNIWAIAKHVEALRGQQRWGVGSIDQAFRGYTALPPVGGTVGMNWWEVLGVPVNSDPDQVKEAYRVLVRKHHPDVGGENERFQRIQQAWEQFERIARKAA